MGVVLGVVFLVLGIVAMTPAGAALSMRMNADHPNVGQGYRPKTLTGTRVLGFVIAVVGVVAIVSQA